MSTFAELANKTRIDPGKAVDKVLLFREAEDDFIERTHCVEAFTETDTSDEGTLTDLYDLPTGFIKAHRISWEGCRLEEAPQGTRASIYQTDGEVYPGWPYNFWIEDEQIRLIPKPTQHGTLRFWYTKYNATRTATSPIIPALEQNKLINQVSTILSEMNGDLKSAAYYRSLYEADVTRARLKYKNQRFASGEYAYYRDVSYTNVGQYGVATVNNEDEFIWKKVALADYTDVPATEETFITGTGELTAGALDSPQTNLPTFRSSNTHVIQVTTAYQDRGVHLSTEPTVDSSGRVTFGLTLSESGIEGTACYFDIKLTISS